MSTTFDTYAGPEYEIRQTWQLRKDTPYVDTEQLPSISINGYTVELVALYVERGRVLLAGIEFDGELLSDVTLTPSRPGWTLGISGTSLEYTFPTVFDAMAHAMHSLV